GDWFNTGDQFYQDDEGYFWYQGRRNDMFKTGGMWVSPVEVEGVLLDHSLVSEAAMTGAPDESGLEKPMAFVVLKNGEESSDLKKELTALVRDRIAHYKAPHWIRFVNELPRTATGKIRRYQLKASI
ncbi:MAG: benzoate-CoA ligase family protein, partial [Acidobacteria bacterium]|nr:benzoate-CoA ligase family protein [Acidobacteriota bacterium]